MDGKAGTPLTGFSASKLKDSSSPSLSAVRQQKPFAQASGSARANRTPSAPSARASPYRGTPNHGASRALSEEQSNEIKEAFELFDSDKDGTLDYHEFKVAMKALGFDCSNEEVSQLLQQLDRAGTGRVQQADFHHLMTQKVLDRDPVEEMRKAFKLFASESGVIDLDALRSVAEQLHEESIEEGELRAMISEFDQNGDGVIDEAEFLDIMAQAARYDA
eukprot:g40136.t1